MSLRPVCLLLPCCLLLLPETPSAAQDKRRAVEPPHVQVSLPVVREVTDYEDFPGRIEATQSVDVRPRVTGYLDKVVFKPGATVKKGDLLFEIDPRPYEAELRKAEAMVKVRELRLKRAAADLERGNRLLKTKAITQEEFDRLQNDRDLAAAELALDRANLDAARVNLDFTRVRAPINGRIGRPSLDAGNLVKADDTTLATIVSTDPVYACFDVDERTLLRLARLAGGKTELGLPVLMRLADEEAFAHRGKVDFVDNRLDASTGTLRIRAVFPNDGQLLRPGMFVRVRVPVGAPHKALLVADGAAWSEQGRKYVYVVTEKNVARRRPVHLGALHGGLREVTEGLTAEDWVVVGGQQNVKPDRAVKPQRVPMPSPGK